MSERAAVCRQLLEHVANIARLQAIAAEVTAMGYPSLMWKVRPYIRSEVGEVRELAVSLGLPYLTLHRDAAAFARAQLGLPIDAPVSAPKPRRPSSASWKRDLADGAAVA